VNIQESPVKPVWAFGRPLKRVGRTNQRLSPEETKRLLEVTTGRTWDSLPCPGLLINHLDRGLIESFLRRVGQDTTSSTISVLQNLSLLMDNRPSNAAALLFTQNPGMHVVEAQVMCARFQGIDSVHFLDNHNFSDDIFSQLEDSLNFVARNTRQQPIITGQSEHRIVSQYPGEAIREAITNAICHRDYTMTGTVQVRIYDDRLEVWNPGMLPSGITVEDLYHEHPSRPRNPRLATAMHRARVIEHWGTGTLRIVKACESSGMDKPEFISRAGSFIVRFKSSPLNSEQRIGIDRTITLNNRQTRALTYIKHNGSIRKKEYAELFGISSRQALKDITGLLNENLVIKVSAGKNTHYTLPSARIVRE
jgi:ATP-dependent DNA helicase RecG